MNKIFFDGYTTLKDICQGFVYTSSSPLVPSSDASVRGINIDSDNGFAPIRR